MFEQYQPYMDSKGFDLHHLSGQLFPFLDYNKGNIGTSRIGTTMRFEGLMWRLNAKVRSASFDIGGESRVPTVFRESLLGYELVLSSVSDTRLHA